MAGEMLLALLGRTILLACKGHTCPNTHVTLHSAWTQRQNGFPETSVFVHAIACYVKMYLCDECHCPRVMSRCTCVLSVTVTVLCQDVPVC